jgi:hypothetical protein
MDQMTEEALWVALRCLHVIENKNLTQNDMAIIPGPLPMLPPHAKRGVCQHFVPRNDSKDERQPTNASIESSR